jgi:hypothetical protein
MGAVMSSETAIYTAVSDSQRVVARGALGIVLAAVANQQLTGTVFILDQAGEIVGVFGGDVCRGKDCSQ